MVPLNIGVQGPMITKILTFLKGIPLIVWGAVAAVLLLAGVVAYCSTQVEKRVELAEEKGQVTEQKKNLEQTIKNIEVANEAEQEILETSPRGDSVRYRQCLRTARTPENCERFLSGVQED